MRTGLITMGLLAIALQGCGGGETTSTPSGPAPPGHAVAAGGEVAATPAASGQAGASSATGGSATTAAAPAAPGSAGGAATSSGDAATSSAAGDGFVAARRPGRAPAVVLVADAQGETVAEARELSTLGVASISVTDPRSVGALRVALANLRARGDVDPSRIAVAASGRSTVVAAKLLAREPMVSVAVLSDPPSSASRALRQLSAGTIMLERSDGNRALSSAAAKRLVIASPPGTLLYERPSLRDPAAMRERDTWLRNKLR